MAAILGLVSMVQIVAASIVPSWSFDRAEDVAAWVANADLKNVTVKDGVVGADAAGSDPFFSCDGLSFEATPYQTVTFTMKASESGTCYLFWTGTTEGPNGGLSELKKTPVEIVGDSQWHEITIMPCWHVEGAIRRLRFDVFDGAHFELKSIRIEDKSAGVAPQTSGYAWDTVATPWTRVSVADEVFAPPLRLSLEGKAWVSVRLKTDMDGTAALLWSAADTSGLQVEPFPIRRSSEARTYFIEMALNEKWTGDLLTLGVRFPKDADVTLESVTLGEEPIGPARFEVSYFGFENGVNRVGKPARVTVRIVNRGAMPTNVPATDLILPDAVELVEKPAAPAQQLSYEDYVDLTWTVVGKVPGAQAVKATFAGDAAPEEAAAALMFMPALELPKADYVPEPKPIQTTMDVAAYYFPGWESARKWDCIQRVAPIRKPVLGYYDESNPECVDWQIKWSVENGINVYLVDWYWVKGSQYLTHWFDAYRKTRYRDMLKVAVMWANHNPEGSHSVEDWRAVTKEWIDRYFNLPSYYRINDKPAVFLWNPEGLRGDLKDSATVKSALDESQQMARDAGYKGIEFVVVNGSSSPALVKLLVDEGYAGATNYHEWGGAARDSMSGLPVSYEDVVKSAPDAWAKRDEVCAGLMYYPLVDTGWDARPWHGDRSLQLVGRTPERFERILREAKTYCEAHAKRLVVLGPVNEWGEGSYIEPCAEYDFGMLEAVRAVFGKGDPSLWPVNVAPSDIGLGPYDFPARPEANVWNFDNDADGWASMMGVSDLRAEDGSLRFRTASGDPAITASLAELKASKFTTFEFTIRIAGASTEAAAAQLFWSRGSTMSEAASVSVPVKADGSAHTYSMDLKANPNWRGFVSTLRFDPCNVANVDVTIDSMRFR
ncbi:MAG: glycoside hydrolase family 99-like domain-containing protein [Candidatus Hydrogenedentes bacterium]|nr:glycoside hydrolase family 99-like domain-containing protein [Candidatus Hydrogenedentota bacterium]